MTLRTRAYCLSICALLLALAALPHSFAAWPHFQSQLLNAGVDHDLIAALNAGWYFGSVAMLGFAGVVAHAARTAFRGERPAAVPLGVIAAVYLVLGVTAWVMRDFNSHYFGFIVPGAALALAAGWKSAPP